MKSPPRLLTLSGLLLCGALAACAKPTTPVAGEYRAVLVLKGGEIPLKLKVGPGNTAGASAAFTVTVGERTLTATGVETKDGQVTAQWPELGRLTARFDRNTLRGEWQMNDAQGGSLTVPMLAQLNQPWRFSKEVSTDNADISGQWRVQGSAEGTAAPIRLRLSQHHDQADGVMTWSDGREVGVTGQTHGDTVYLGSLGFGRAVLFKGTVNAQGALQGQVWINQSAAAPWIIQRDDQPVATESSVARRLGLPWAVPVREVSPETPH